jgi:hypothetical protein
MISLFLSTVTFGLNAQTASMLLARLSTSMSILWSDSRSERMPWCDREMLQVFVEEQEEELFKLCHSE